jgi:hypothetical protein
VKFATTVLSSSGDFDTHQKIDEGVSYRTQILDGKALCELKKNVEKAQKAIQSEIEGQGKTRISQQITIDLSAFEAVTFGIAHLVETANVKTEALCNVSIDDLLKPFQRYDRC